MAHLRDVVYARWIVKSCLGRVGAIRSLAHDWQGNPAVVPATARAARGNVAALRFLRREWEALPAEVRLLFSDAGLPFRRVLNLAQSVYVRVHDAASAAPHEQDHDARAHCAMEARWAPIAAALVTFFGPVPAAELTDLPLQLDEQFRAVLGSEAAQRLTAAEQHVQDIALETTEQINDAVRPFEAAAAVTLFSGALPELALQGLDHICHTLTGQHDDAGH